MLSRGHRKKKHFLLQIATAIFFSSAVFSQNNSASSKPNIIYIMADDMGYADLSCYGRKEYSTPNLDKLASEGMKFMNAYAAAPVCTPTRAAFMTGRYSARIPIGLREPAIPGRDSAVGLSAEIPSIASRLKTAGYETALIGKWHLGFVNKFAPNQNGFDYFYGIRTGAADYISHKGDGGRIHDLYENEDSVYENGYLTDIFSDKAVKFLKRKHEQPFFLCLTFTAPHWPWQVPGDAPYPDTMRWINGGTIETYGVMMRTLDEAVSNILKTVNELGMSNNTLVIFTSDNGGEKFSDMGGYRGKKLMLLEGGIRVPAFVRWPGKIKPNSTTTQVATTLDWTATILAAAGAKPNKDFPLDGVDLLPVCMGQAKPFDRTLYWRTIERSHHKAVRDGNWKYLKIDNEEFLFDLSQDPTEKNNLRDKQSAKFQELKNKYAAWEAMMLPTFVKSQ